MVLNENGVHFLNFARPNKIDFFEKIAKFKIFIQNNGIDPKDILIDSSFILSLYGLRDANDIDYLLDENGKIKNSQDDFEVHDSELHYHEASKLKLLYDQSFHFWFDDLKFISFNQLYKMKKNRAEEKDINDCKIMEALIEDNAFKKRIEQMKQSICYFKIKTKKVIREAMFVFLRKTKLYEPIRSLYRVFRGRK